jgi:NADH:ubiquinone oxidoreductase subunit F (NADH-binding)
MDERNKIEKLLWNVIGEPLYYCEECLRCVSVKTIDNEVVIKRNCNHDESQIIAPRKSTLSGKGFAGLSTGKKIKVTYQQIASKITGRNI